MVHLLHLVIVSRVPRHTSLDSTSHRRHAVSSALRDRTTPTGEHLNCHQLCNGISPPGTASTCLGMPNQVKAEQSESDECGEERDDLWAFVIGAPPDCGIQGVQGFLHASDGSTRPPTGTGLPAPYALPRPGGILRCGTGNKACPIGVILSPWRSQPIPVLSPCFPHGP